MPYDLTQFTKKKTEEANSATRYDLTQFSRQSTSQPIPISPNRAPSPQFLGKLGSAHTPVLDRLQPRTGLAGAAFSNINETGVPSLIGKAAGKIGLDSVAKRAKDLDEAYAGYQTRGIVEGGVGLIAGQLPLLPFWALGGGPAKLIGKGLSKIPAVGKVASKLPGIVKGGLEDAAAYATTVAPAEAAIRSLNDTGNMSRFGGELLQREKQVPLMGAGGVAVRGALKIGGKALGKLTEGSSWGNIGELVGEIRTGKLPELPPVSSAISKATTSSATGPLKVVTPEQKAFTKLQEGIEIVQNHYGHNDVLAPFPAGTTLEKAFAMIKAETGVDLPKLTTNLERASVNAKSVAEMFPADKAKLARVAGVRPGPGDVTLRQPTPEFEPRAEIESPIPKARIETPLEPPNPKGTAIEEAIAKEAAKPGATEKTLREKAQVITSKLDETAETVLERINKNKGRVMSGIPVDLMADYALYGSIKVAKGAVEFGVWSAEMVKDLGEEIRPYLQQIWKQAQNSHKELTKAIMSQQPEVDLAKIKDISGFKAYTMDVYRVFRQVFGEQKGGSLLQEFDRAKGAYIDDIDNLLSRVKSEVVDNLGISKKSYESELVQKYGERVFDEDALRLFNDKRITKEQLEMLNLDKLKEIAPDDWQRIVDADKWFRNEYDSLIDRVNTVRKLIYPNAEQNIAKMEAKIKRAKDSKKYSAAEKNDRIKRYSEEMEDYMRGKIVPKREDYYRHFKEMAEGVKALKNIFDSPAQISTDLIGTSEFTQPNSKWASFMQKRTGSKTEYDAVGGFLNYVPSASYSINIDPQIGFFRGLERAIKETTTDTHNADSFILFLHRFADDLAGKTNPLDRVFQEMVPGGRKTFAALNWLNNRVKANVILGKFGSALAQLANVPAGMAFAKKYSGPGFMKAMAAIKTPSEEMAKSIFLKERYGGPTGQLFNQFDESLLSKPKQMAVWLMETADKAGTTFIWNSAYAKGLAEKAANPIRYADLMTRDLVAGRGIGEVPILQKSKLFQLFAPFQLEVANLWHIQKDMVNRKDFGGLIGLYFLNYLFNEGMEKVRGSRVVFDPIDAVKDAVTEKDINLLQRGGRIGGEVLSNMPLGQTLASAWPEFGTEIGGVSVPSRKQLFGRNDPTRYGSGILLTKAAQDPLFKLFPPFGGEQIKKTYQGIKGLAKEGQYKNDKLSFPIEPTLPNLIRAPFFGPSATTEAQEYYDKNRRPLSEKQTKQVERSPNPSGEYSILMLLRAKETIDRKIAEVKKDPKLSPAQKQAKIRELAKRKAELKK